MRELVQIVAVGQNNEIGKDNQLLWHLPDDFKWFKKHTIGHPVIMGRKTFESMGKPLPGRLNIIVSRTPRTLENTVWTDSVEKAVEIAQKQNDRVFILGGASLFKDCLPITDTIYLTKVFATFDAEVFYPELNPQEWKLTYSQFHPKDAKHLYDFEFEILKRVGK
ncbi:MAG: dihydrofolate reductase [Bacteroidia bacterium]|jgi:dihydrofolate reductase|nr:dihydrofolate reductase [Bacteroidia bacterium]MCO5253474.1 dihydrofolate reductase [Bacteroidota bacterium]MCZ2131321.1 dihydrofolate reductase [Bacteroidia bacterium]